MLTTLLLFLVGLILGLIILGVVLTRWVSSRTNAPKDEYEFITRDGRKVTLTAWQAMKISHNASPTYRLDHDGYLVYRHEERWERGDSAR